MISAVIQDKWSVKQEHVLNAYQIFNKINPLIWGPE